MTGPDDLAAARRRDLELATSHLGPRPGVDEARERLADALGDPGAPDEQVTVHADSLRIVLAQLWAIDRRAAPAHDRHGAEVAHRDGLARDVAQWWVRHGNRFTAPMDDKLAAALDRLAKAYGAS